MENWNKNINVIPESWKGALSFAILQPDCAYTVTVVKQT